MVFCIINKYEGIITVTHNICSNKIIQYETLTLSKTDVTMSFYYINTEHNNLYNNFTFV